MVYVNKIVNYYWEIEIRSTISWT